MKRWLATLGLLNVLALVVHSGLSWFQAGAATSNIGSVSQAASAVGSAATQVLASADGPSLHPRVNGAERDWIEAGELSGAAGGCGGRGGCGRFRRAGRSCCNLRFCGGSCWYKERLVRERTHHLRTGTHPAHIHKAWRIRVWSAHITGKTWHRLSKRDAL